jgi:PAS domain S-box-containing protein
MADLQFILNGSRLNTIFPFYILIDEQLFIKGFGKSISKMLPDLKEDNLFTDYFTIVRPSVQKVKPSNFNSLLDQLVVFTSKGFTVLTLRGQFEKHDNGFLFVGSPWFMSIEDVEKSKLLVSDFANHDPLIDILQVLKNQKTTNKELKELIETNEEQRKKLNADKEELNRLSLVASANKNGVVFTHLDGKIFWCNDAYIALTGFLRTEIIGKSLLEIGSSKFSNKEELFKMVEACYRGDSFDVEYLHSNKAGTLFLAKITGQPILDSSGLVSQYFAIVEDITLEKEREEQLLLLSSIAEKNNNPVIISDKEGKVEWANSSFVELTEFSMEEILGQQPDVLLHGPETDPKTINYLKIQIKHGLPFDCEIINYTKSKQKYWVKIQGQALHDKYGEIKKYFTIQEDITFEKEYNQQLIESENRLSSLITNLRSGVLLEDENGKILLVNRQFCNFYGIDADPDLLKGFDSKLIYQGTKHLHKYPVQFLERIAEITEQNEVIIAEEIELIDGRVLEISFIPIFTGDKYNGNLWSYEDVTIKKKYKESLEAEREKYSNIIANMNMGLLEIDRDDIVQLANQSFYKMSGLGANELIGKKITDLFLTDITKKIIEEKIKDRTNKKADSYEIQIVNKSGEKKHWLISGAPNYNVNGEITGSISLHLDITEQKQLQLQKEYLLKKLEEQNDHLNEYAQMVSHDLKSPLRSIHSLIAWIKEDNQTEFSADTKRYFEMIENKVEKMDNLIRGILMYSKIATAPGLNENTNLNEVLQNIIKIIHIPENISVRITNELPILEIDQFRMQQLFQNLISNAVNYSDKENGIVEIASSEDKEYYIFSIKDNGPGIDIKYQDKIFKMFESFSQNEESTGIGLSIVKRIVDNYNGEISIDSQLGRGTTFIIKLPKKYGTSQH